MRHSKRSRNFLFVVVLYLGFCMVAAIFVADGTMHPSRRILTQESEITMRQAALRLTAELRDVSISAQDQMLLRAWSIRPNRSNGNAVILLHGLADNRIGMAGYAQFLLANGFTVLLPDSRAHGASESDLATYGLLERNDIRQWFEFLSAEDHPRCIFGFGESMGAAELLQSLTVEPHFCAVVAESPFSSFREIAYDRMGQPFHLGTWFGRTLFRPTVEFALLYVRWRYGIDMREVSPEDAVAKTNVPIFLIHGQLDNNISLRHSHRIQIHNARIVLWEVPGADHCGAISVAPEEFDRRLLSWFSTNQQLRLRTEN